MYLVGWFRNEISVFKNLGFQKRCVFWFCFCQNGDGLFPFLKYLFRRVIRRRVATTKDCFVRKTSGHTIDSWHISVLFVQSLQSSWFQSNGIDNTNTSGSRDNGYLGANIPRWTKGITKPYYDVPESRSTVPPWWKVLHDLYADFGTFVVQKLRMKGILSMLFDIWSILLSDSHFP